MPKRMSDTGPFVRTAPTGERGREREREREREKGERGLF